jgi:hypothetical protein
MTTGVFPAAELKPARGGILDGASVTEHADSWGQWTNGAYFWTSDACPVDLILSDYCSNAAEGIIASNTSGSSVEGWPFGIITRYTCLTVGTKLEEMKATALKQNRVGTQKGLEYELWTGGISRASNHLNNRYLSGPTSVNVTPGVAAVSVKLGIAALEQALADCGLGAAGVIHMTRSAAALAPGTGTIEWDDNGKLVTILKTPVIAGVGYDTDVVWSSTPNSSIPVPAPGPVGPMATKQWMYATGPVSVHLGPSEIIDTPPMTNIRTNEISILAGRPAAIYYDSCCTFAVNVDLEK